MKTPSPYAHIFSALAEYAICALLEGRKCGTDGIKP